VRVEREPSPKSGTGGRDRKPTLEDRFIARMLAQWLDEELGRGVGASLSEAHAARAEQLAGDRARRGVVRSLDRLVDRAQRPRSASLLIQPCPEQVRDAMPLILSIRARLLSGEQLAAQGIAQLKTLLRDRDGACYLASGDDTLTAALQRISDVLDAEQITSD
jgi:hypothetical protein